MSDREIDTVAVAVPSVFPMNVTGTDSGVLETVPPCVVTIDDGESENDPTDGLLFEMEIMADSERGFVAWSCTEKVEVDWGVVGLTMPKSVPRDELMVTELGLAEEVICMLLALLTTLYCSGVPVPRSANEYIGLLGSLVPMLNVTG